MSANNGSSYDRRYSQISTEYNQDLSSYSGQPCYPLSPLQQTTPLAAAYELRERQALVESPITNSKGSKYSAVQQVQDINETENSAPSAASGRDVNTGYNPLFTRKWTLWCFSLLWLLIIASLQTIYSVSEAQKGLATTSPSLRFLWTYGPTAFFVVVTVVWRQVDYAGESPSYV